MFHINKRFEVAQFRSLGVEVALLIYCYPQSPPSLHMPEPV